MARSLPYTLLLAAIGFGVCGYLFIMFDQVAHEIFASGTWGTGGPEATEGQQYVREMWSRALLILLTGAATTLIVISRRTSGGVWR